MKQPTFIKVANSLLLNAKHFIGGRLLFDFATAVNLNPADYANPGRGGTFVGIRPTSVMLGLVEDAKKRLRALKTVEESPVAFCVAMAVQSLPIAAPGSATQQAFDKLRCKLSVETSQATTIEAIHRIANKCVAQLGVEEPEGDMSAAPPKAYFHTSAAAGALEAAAGAIQSGKGGGGRGKGKGKGKGLGNGTATVQLDAASDQGRPG